ncbi:hypothetical protein ACP4OV_011716 [Aristida adscensionis]
MPCARWGSCGLQRSVGRRWGRRCRVAAGRDLGAAACRSGARRPSELPEAALWRRRGSMPCAWRWSSCLQRRSGARKRALVGGMSGDESPPGSTWRRRFAGGPPHTACAHVLRAHGAVPPVVAARG